MQRRCDVAGENARRFKAEDRSYSLTAGEDAVTHRRMNGSRLRGCSRQQPLESGIDDYAAFLEEWGKFHRGREWASGGVSWRVTTSSPARERKVQQPACHRLSSRESLLAPRPLPVASGIRARVRRLLR